MSSNVIILSFFFPSAFTVLNISASVSDNFANISWILAKEQMDSELYVAYMKNRKPILPFIIANKADTFIQATKEKLIYSSHNYKAA